MSGRTGFLIDDQAPRQDKWNAHMRWTAHDTAQMIAAHVFGELTTTISTGDARVLGGLAASVGSGMQTDYTAGLALHYDATVYTAVLDGEDTCSPFGWQLIEADGNLTHDAAHATLVRVDLICTLSTIGTDRSESVQQKGGGTSAQDTRWGAESSIVIVKGTAGAGAPAVPTGYTKVAEVSIPALAASAAAFTYTDKRIFGSNTDITDDNYTVYSEGTGSITLLGAFRQDATDSFAILWDKTDHWPAFARTNEPAGDETGSLYLMGIPGSRSYTIFAPFSGGNWRRPTSGGGLEIEDYNNEVQIDRTGVSAEQFEWSATLPLAARGLEITGGTVYWDIDTAFDGTIGNQTLNVKVYDEAGATAATLVSSSPAMAVAGSGKTVALSGTHTIAAGEYVGLNLTFGLSADGTAVGRITIHGVSLTLKEGRA